jgi:hypothetical protein
MLFISNVFWILARDKEEYGDGAAFERNSYWLWGLSSAISYSCTMSVVWTLRRRQTNPLRLLADAYRPGIGVFQQRIGAVLASEFRSTGGLARRRMAV